MLRSSVDGVGIVGAHGRQHGRTFVVGHRPVRIATLFAACLPACVASDDPSLSVYVDTHGVLISVNREPDHSFGQVRATINGVDAGTPQYTPGRDGTLKSVSEPATASFLVPQAQIGSSLHVAIDDDGAHYTLDVPDFGSPRTPTVVTSLDVPLRPGDWVELTTGIASDRIGNGCMIGKLDGRDCFTQAEIGGAVTKLQVPLDLVRSWDCAIVPTSGTPLAIKLAIGIALSPVITTCTGPALTCDPIDLFLPTATFDATVEIPN